MAKIYVGTYAKYNSGSIAGAWLDLEDYSDKEEFLEACADLHKDETDPELMFQDFEDIPSGMVSESSIDKGIWEWLELSDDDKEMFKVYKEHVNSEGTIEEVRDAYYGKFDSAADWAASFIEECGMLESMPENLRGYFDYEAYAKDCAYDGMSFVETGYHEVWVFRNV